ncbi:hypothetical protein [Luteolibacter soli]|uniref:Uncharacterized protein n=1 Tax=Luteolibacter soli TaxID=3135280 RepID=A0ABU9AQZ1_9BACT
MLLYKLHFLTPGESTRRALSARLVAGARPDAFVARVRSPHQPDATGVPAKRDPKLP